jgi:hypothetical protein
MKKVALLVGLTVLASLTLAADSWTGVISDEKCAKADASHASCAERCIKGGGNAVLVSDGKVVKIANQDKVKGHAGHKVTVTGTLKDGAITVTDVKMAEDKK